MAGQLVQISCPIDFFPESVALVESQYQELVELRADRRRLERENLEFRQQVGYWKSRHRDALLRIAALEQKIEQLEGEKRQLHADLFGRRSETKPLNDRSNHLVLQRHVRQPSMAQGVIFQELKSFLRISIRTWLMDQKSL
jgi:chromosome segregation ATPase